MRWERQRDMVACLGLLTILIFLVVWGGSGKGLVFGPEAGASLQAPADPSEPYAAARPEWYFLFLYQLLKYFPGESEIYGAVVIPGVAALIFVLLPYIGVLNRGHALAVGIVFGVLGGAALLAVVAIREDETNLAFQKGFADARIKAQRAIRLALDKGIPRAGAVELLRRDPMTQGPILFRDNCATCHRWNGHDGTGLAVMEFRKGKLVPLRAAASDLAGFGTQRWIKEFLKNPDSDKFFGRTGHKNGAMAKWAKRNLHLLSEEELDAVSAFLAAQSKRDPAPGDPELLMRGAEVFSLGSFDGAQPCADCHKLDHPDFGASGTMMPAPNLTAYGSKEWLHGIVTDPGQADFYGPRNDRMPKFSERLTPAKLNLLIEWMTSSNR